LRLQPGIGDGNDAFISELDRHVTALVYSTFFGGSLGAFAASIAVGVRGNGRDPQSR